MSDMLQDEIANAQKLVKDGDKKAAAPLAAKAEVDYEKITDYIMDMMDRPENGGILRAMLNRIRQARDQKM